jgi:hypothetical protein
MEFMYYLSLQASSWEGGGLAHSIVLVPGYLLHKLNIVLVTMALYGVSL